MATIVTRSGKGSALTHTEMDNNFTNLNTDKPDVVGTPVTGNLASFDASDDVQDSGIATSAVTTLTGTQTLTNKTLTSPDINGGTWNGTIDGNVTAVAATISPTEFSYLDGVTSNIQNQLDAKAPSFAGALVYNSGDWTSTTNLLMTFDSEVYDTNSIHSTVSNTSRLTVPSGVTKVRISYGFYMDAASGTAYYSADTRKNGSLFIGSAVSSGARHVGAVSPVLQVTAGDYFEVYTQDPTTGRTISAGESWFAMEIIE